MSNCKVIALVALALMFLNQACKKEEETDNIACIPSALESGVVAFYPFSNGSLNDVSGNGHNLTNNTTAHATADRKGNSNCAWQFANSTALSPEFLTIVNPTFLNSLTSFSISLWYQPTDSTRDSGEFEVLMGRDDGIHCPNKRGQWSVGLYDCRRAVFGRLASVWDNEVAPLTATCEEEGWARTGTWHHLAATYNAGNNGEMKIYRDGVLQETDSGTAPCSITPTVQNIGNLLIGTDYTGRIDDIIIYDKTLTQTEVSQLKDLEPCCD